MKLVVDHIKEKPSHLQVDNAVDEFPVLAGLESDGVCRFVGHVRGEVASMREFDHLRVNGDVAVPAVFTCSRCLVDYEERISSRFTIMYRKAEPSALPEEDETELDEQDLVSATYDGSEIDLSFEIGEQLAMELPIKPLCSLECKGLCPVCGADLNQSQCGCDREVPDPRFSSLKDFKVRTR